MKWIEPETSPDEINILHSYVAHEARTEQCEQSVYIIGGTMCVYVVAWLWPQ